MSEIKPCPFCGGMPRVDLDKVTYCQLHGDPSQSVRVYCYHECPSRPSVSAGDAYNGGEARARAEAIAAWNTRAAPAELVEALEHAEAILSGAPEFSTNKRGKGPNTSTRLARDKVRAALANYGGENDG